MKVTFDTNVLVYATDTDAGARHDRAILLLRQAARADAVMILQSLAEFFHVTTRKVMLPADAALTFIQDWYALFPIVAADDEGLIEAVGAVEAHGLAFWDAMLWAAARRAGCRLLLSEDFQDGRSLGGVTFVDPFAAHNAVLLNAALPEVR